MYRLSGLLLALMFAVMPTVDMVCRALCTPDPIASAAPACHEVAFQSADGVLLPAVDCQRDVIAVVAPAEAIRNLASPGQVVTSLVTVFAPVSASASVDGNRQPVRPRPLHGYPSTIVLRI